MNIFLNTNVEFRKYLVKDNRGFLKIFFKGQWCYFKKLLYMVTLDFEEKFFRDYYRNYHRVLKNVFGVANGYFSSRFSKRLLQEYL